MPILKQSESTYTPPPEGTHPARCYGMISLGTQPVNNPNYKPSFTCLLQFELPNETIERDGKRLPLSVTKFVGAHLGRPNKPSKTTEFLVSWRGKKFTDEEWNKFDLANVVGAPCLLSIVHETKNGQTRESISSIMPLPKGMTLPPQFNPSIKYEIEEGRNAKFQALPEWIQTMIGKCLEWTTPPAPVHDEPEHADANEDTSVPF